MVGTVLLVIAALGLLFLLRRRRRGRNGTRLTPITIEKGDDKPPSKSELAGVGTKDSNSPYNKPELAAMVKPQRSELSSSHSTSTPHEIGAVSSQENILPHIDNADPQTKADYIQEKQVLENERLTSSHKEALQIQNEDSVSPASTFVNRDTPVVISPHENLNVLKAQEREMAHQMEISEELQRMRAEHAALLDRIRIAEMREREVRGGL